MDWEAYVQHTSTYVGSSVHSRADLLLYKRHSLKKNEIYYGIE